MADHANRPVTTVANAASTMSAPAEGDGAITRYSDAISADRIVTLDTNSAVLGMRWTVIRELACTGAFVIDVGGIADLASPGESVTVYYNGSAWAVLDPGSASTSELKTVRDAGDAAATLTAPVDGDGTTLMYEATITANRAVALTTAGATEGMRWTVLREAAATGEFSVDVGTGPLKSLNVPGESATVVYDGTAWVLLDLVPVRTSADAGDAAATLTAAVDGDGAVLLYEQTITADRAVTLSTTGATTGMRWTVLREAACTGEFSVLVGTGPLKALETPGESATVVFDGTAWVLLDLRPTRTVTDAGDAAATMTAAVDGDGAKLFYDVPIAADRAVTLSTTNATTGMTWRVIREIAATGGFNVNVGTGPLTAMGTVGEWCDVTFDGSAWVLSGFGTLA